MVKHVFNGLFVLSSIDDGGRVNGDKQDTLFPTCQRPLKWTIARTKTSARAGASSQRQDKCRFGGIASRAGGVTSSRSFASPAARPMARSTRFPTTGITFRKWNNPSSLPLAGRWWRKKRWLRKLILVIQ